MSRTDPKPCPDCEDGIVSPYCCGGRRCTHVLDNGWTCRRCRGTGEIRPDPEQPR